MSRVFSCSRLSLAAGTALLLSACLDHPLKAVEYEKEEEGTKTVDIAINKDVDILFMIDNSGSMAAKQKTLAANFGASIGVLEAPDVKANYRIGITTSDAGNPRCPTTTPEGGNLVLSSCRDRIETGEFLDLDEDFSDACTSNCDKFDKDLTVRPTTTGVDDKPAPRRWIENIEGESNIGGVASHGRAVGCYGPPGVAGCGFESQLESIYLSLAKASDSKSISNYGFLRDTALLSVVLVTDEADCSYVAAKSEIFTKNKVFWNSPDDPAPTSSLCWKAGVACTGPGPYTECHAENYDLAAKPGVADTEAVLQPISKYVDFIEKLQDAKQEINKDQKILISLISGVPVGYENFKAELLYADDPDQEQQDLFGIGPGCVFTDPDDPDAGFTAVPSVREREWAEAFQIDEKQRNLFSICQKNYSAALDAIATKIRDQIKPACMPNCVRDTDPSTPDIVEPTCQLFEQTVDDAGLTVKKPIVQCKEGASAWETPANQTVCFAALTDKKKATMSKLDDMSMECIDKGYNLEFNLVRSQAASSGTTISASCSLSDNKAIDCPKL